MGTKKGITFSTDHNTMEKKIAISNWITFYLHCKWLARDAMPFILILILYKLIDVHSARIPCAHCSIQSNFHIGGIFIFDETHKIEAKIVCAAPALSISCWEFAITIVCHWWRQLMNHRLYEVENRQQWAFDRYHPHVECVFYSLNIFFD